MLKIANQIIDAYDDVSGEGIKKLASIAPNIVMMSHSERAQLQDRDFALCMITKTASKLNKFPINTEDNTWLSNQYFAMNGMKLNEKSASIAAHHIKTACNRFNLIPTVQVEHMAKEASSNIYYEDGKNISKQTPITRVNLEKFAQVDKIGNNYTHAQFVFSSPGAIKFACEYFDKYASVMPVESRHKYAAAIQRRANELGMETQKGTVEKYASDHYSPQVDAHLSMRRTLLEGKDDLISGINKLASAKKQLSPSDFAKTLHGFDKKAGLSKYYGGQLLDPFLASFASAPDPYAGYIYKKAGLVLEPDTITKIAHAKYAKVKEYFGSSIADEFKSNPVPIFDSLPNDSKEIIAGIANGTH